MNCLSIMSHAHINASCWQAGSCVAQTNGAVRSIVRKKAALCLLRLLRKAGPEADILQADTWSVKMVCRGTSPYHTMS